MSYKFRPPPPNRSYGQSPPGFVYTSTSSPSYDWRAQQSLFMGANTPMYHRQILVSPQVSNKVSNFGTTTPTYQTRPPDTSIPFPGRVMYPSSAYNYGNPDYYCNPLQFPVSHETQTSPTYVPYQASHTPVHTTSPVLDTNTNGSPTHQVPCTTQSVPPTIPTSRADEKSSHESHFYFQDTTDENSSFLHPTNQQPHPYADLGNTPPPNQWQYYDANCQVTSSQLNPVTLVKETKKNLFRILTLPR